MDAATYCHEIWRKRYFWWSLVQIDLRTRYRRSVLGMGWSLLHPIAMTAVLCLVFAAIFNLSLREYAPYVLSGMAVWGFLTAAALDGCRSYLQAEAYIRQQPAPLAIYPLRTALSAAIHLLLALAVLVVFAWVLNGPVNVPWLPVAVPGIALLFLCGWAMAICAGTLNVLFQDTQHLVQVGLQMLFYASPVFAEERLFRERGLGWLADFNPVAAFLSMVRDPILYCRFPSVWNVSLATVATAAAMACAVWALARTQRKLIFYL
jgi:ABC-type polysaccharide/polyol phosphate export permease